MLRLSSELIYKCKQKRKQSYSQLDLQSYIKYSLIMMPEELCVSIKKSAAFFGLSTSSAYRIRNDYIKQKPKINNWGGRRKSSLSLKDELNFIQNLKNEISHGRSFSAKEIKARIENILDKTLHKTSVYRLLDRHSCKKIIKKTTKSLKI